MSSAIRELLAALYGTAQGTRVYDRLSAMLERPQDHGAASAWQPDQAEAFLIAYPDQVREPGVPPLRSLGDFLRVAGGGLFSGLHLLPFYPSSSDDGFSVTDYRSVDPAYGDWSDVEALGRPYHLMFDAVINHASVQGAWFREFLRGRPPYADYFIAVDGSPDLSGVVRPRALPLLTHFHTATGTKRVWTTFSSDQADLNYAKPDLLLEIIGILLQYASRGARFLRLDAVAYLWKRLGTPCIHLPETYLIVRLLRAVMDACEPQVRLVTETNVPHAENITYLGDGTDMAHMVYNFALPPLVLQALHSENSAALSRWLSTLTTPPGGATYLNFLASHDGIGLQPMRGVLATDESTRLVERFAEAGAAVAYRSSPEGLEPYELNLNYFDALNWFVGGRSPEMEVERFLLAHAILLSIVGVPAIYFHSLVGSRGWTQGPSLTGSNRSINREKLQRGELEAELSAPDSRRAVVLKGLLRLLRARRACPAFAPQSVQAILDLGPGVLAILRTPAASLGRVFCLSNVTPRPQTLSLRNLASAVPGRWPAHDLILDAWLPLQGASDLAMSPYQAMWLEIDAGGELVR